MSLVHLRSLKGWSFICCGWPGQQQNCTLHSPIGWEVQGLEAILRHLELTRGRLLLKFASPHLVPETITPLPKNHMQTLYALSFSKGPKWLSSSASPGKRQSVTQILFNMPTEVFECVAKHVSENTWEQSVFTDEALANKRIYPGSLFKFNKPGWQDVYRKRVGLVRSCSQALTKIPIPFCNENLLQGAS